MDFVFHRIDLHYQAQTNGLPVIIFMLVCDKTVPLQVLTSYSLNVITTISEKFPGANAKPLVIPKDDSFLLPNTRAHFAMTFSSQEELKEVLAFLRAQQS